jgi:hypothetical protein
VPVFIDPTGESTFGLGICARCSKKMPLGELYDDPNAIGLKVCIDDLDDYDPYRLAARPTEFINLPFVRPDRPLADVIQPDPTQVLFYIRGTTPTNFRIVSSGQFREIGQAPDGGIPPWEL